MLADYGLKQRLKKEQVYNLAAGEVIAHVPLNGVIPPITPIGSR